MRRLEIIADTFLSMNAPVQHAVPGWLRERDAIQRQVRERVQRNLRSLDDAVAAQHAFTRLASEGGWYATLRTPASVTGEELAIRLLEQAGVAVHPGAFFGFAEQNRIVVSLAAGAGGVYCGNCRGDGRSIGAPVTTLFRLRHPCPPLSGSESDVSRDLSLPRIESKFPVCDVPPPE